MTRARDEQSGTSDTRHDGAIAAMPVTELPIVSVVIVNYNYGRFLCAAVGSVLGQTYPNVECVIVDNASTDETPRVLDDLAAAHPELVIIRRAANDGQTPASLDGLGGSRGHYVIFLDADDYLLPHCIETHIYVHLSMRPHVGFTSGDMLQVAGNHVVVSTSEEMSRFVRSRRRASAKLVRPYAATAGWPSTTVRTNIAERIAYVPPLKFSWVWSPTSGLCYRRDALLLFADNARLATLRTGTDLYFAYACSGLSGSVIIDEPLFAYRIHGGNIFTARAQLDRTLNFTVGGSGDSNIKAQLFLIDHLIERAARFTPVAFLAINHVALIYQLDRRDVDEALPRWAKRSRAAQAIVRNWGPFSAAVGRKRARLLLAILARSVRGPRSLMGDL